MDTSYEAQGPISEQQKSLIRAMAKAAGMSIDDFLWQAALAFKSQSEQRAITTLFQELEDTAERTCASIDAATAYIAASNQRMDEMEARARQR